MKAKTKTTATKEEATPALVPKLRFPEFREALEWEKKPLAACLDYQQPTPYLVSGTNYSPAFKTPVLTAGKTFILGYTDEEHGIFNEDLPVIIFDDFTTATQFVDFPFKAKSSAMKILQAKNGANIKFMFETLRTLSYEVGAHERHWISNFAPMLVPVPKPAEQQKIAECLSSVDELIAAQARKVDALKTHKKGLMQQLFPREGETQPRLRFPEFQNAGGWVSEPLGDLGEIVTGKTPSTKELDLWGGDILFITPTDISEDDKYQYTTARTVIETKSTKILPPGSVVYTCIASIGKMALTVHPSITNQQINAVVPNEKALGEFIYYALLNLTPWIKTLPATNTLPIINKTDFSKIAILFPEDKAEQQRITDCLTSLDALIAAQTQKHEALKTHKKGLMQQLFPSPEEVAG